MKTIRFHEAAEDEMLAAARWYEAQKSDLGKRFLAAVQETCLTICINPLIFLQIDGDVRRCLVKRFPYGVLFREQEDCMEVIAVMHLHRDPEYWKTR